MRQLRTWIALTVLSAPLVVSCSDENDPDTTADTGAATVDDGGESDAARGEDDGGDVSRDGGTGGSEAGSAGADGGSQDASGNGDAASSSSDAASSEDSGGSAELTDSQIGAVTSAANNGEVAQANAALPKLSNADVKAYANSMVAMHSAAQTRQAALLQQKQITPQENPTSTMLKQDSDKIVAELSAAAASAVDSLYIDHQVEVHGSVLELLDQVLIPSASDADLRAELVATRGEVRTHLNEAKQLQEALGAP